VFVCLCVCVCVCLSVCEEHSGYKRLVTMKFKLERVSG